MLQVLVKKECVLFNHEFFDCTVCFGDSPRNDGLGGFGSVQLFDSSGLDRELHGLAQDVEQHHHAAFAVGHLVDGF